jgi:DNA-binding transcriptional MerR regulator
VLRYWESEFPTLRPRKSRSGNRSYRWRDVEEVLAIKKLLYEEGFRITGARKLRREAHTAAKVPEEFAPAPQLAIPFSQLEPKDQLKLIRKELVEIMQVVRELKTKGK